MIKQKPQFNNVLGELFEGDIMLTPEQREMVDTGSTEAYAGALKTSYWPNPLPYEIDQSLGRLTLCTLYLLIKNVKWNLL